MENTPFALQRDFFRESLRHHQLPLPRRGALEVLQINLGKLCNQTCRHCHVDAGPHRKEIMPRKVVERLVTFLPFVETVDITGGAPEMNPHFRFLVEQVHAAGKPVIVRCNLTIIEEEGFAWLPRFFADHQVHLISSLPCYGEENVDAQRGQGVFARSIRAILKLNALGYGKSLPLDFVYNPGGASLPPAQGDLEASYKEVLWREHGIVFHRLLTLANLPIGRFRKDLQRQGELLPYMQLLQTHFNPDTLPHLMCRNTLSVDWQGNLYDCDFNQMLDLPLAAQKQSIFDPDFSLETLAGKPIATAEHCLGCTAGSGSSCGGALA